jgi:membrane protein
MAAVALRRVIAAAHRRIDPLLRVVAQARTLGLAAEMSFWLFLSLVPLAAVAGLIAARLAMRHEPFVGGLLSSVPPDVRHMIEDQVQSVANWSAGVAPVALAMFVWLAASGVHAVFDALEVQSGTSRPWWKKRVLALLTCIGLSVGIAALGFLAVGLDRLEALAGRALPLGHAEASVAGGVARFASGFAIAVGMVAALYRIAIPREVRYRTYVWPGTLLAVALIGVLGLCYRLYVSRMGTGDAYLGSLGIIGVTMTMLWLFSIALLLGTALNTVLGERRTSRSGASGAQRRDHVDTMTERRVPTSR